MNRHGVVRTGVAFLASVVLAGGMLSSTSVANDTPVSEPTPTPTTTSDPLGACVPGPDAKCRNADLAGADLSDLNLSGADFSGANLRGANLRGASMPGTDFTGANLAGAQLPDTVVSGATFVSADLSNANFANVYADSAVFANATVTGTDFRGAFLRGADFTNADLKLALTDEATICPSGTPGPCGAINPPSPDRPGGAKVINGCVIEPGTRCTDANLAGANLVDDDLSRANLRGSTLSGSVFDGTNFTAALLARTNFTKARGRNSTMDGANLREANFASVTVTGGDWRGVFAPEIDFFDADLDGTNLEDAEMPRLTAKRLTASGTRLVNADLSGGDFQRARIVDSDWRGAKLIGASLRGARIIASDFDEADLRAADLRDAVLIGGTFRFADLRGADFLGADDESLPDFTGADLSGARWVDGSICRRGSIGTCLGPAEATTSGWVVRGCEIKPYTQCPGVDWAYWKFFPPKGERADLEGANLERADLLWTWWFSPGAQGHSFFMANLRGADLERIGGIFVDQRGKTKAEPLGASFNRANLTGANLRLASLGSLKEGWNEEWVDFSGAKMQNAILNQASIGAAVFAAADLRDAQLIQTYVSPLTSFADADMRNAKLDRLRGAPNTVVNGPVLATFTRANLAGASLAFAQLGARWLQVSGERPDFTEANLQGASLRSAEVWSADFTSVNARSAEFSRATFGSNVAFVRADLTNASFADAQVGSFTDPDARTDFTDTDMRGARFNRANISSANFTRANLQGATFTNAQIEASVLFDDADLSGATWTNGEKCQAGSIGRCVLASGVIELGNTAR